MVDASLQATNPTPNAITGLRAVDREVPPLPPLPPHTLEGHAPHDARSNVNQRGLCFLYLGYKVSHVALLRCIPALSCYLVGRPQAQMGGLPRSSPGRKRLISLAGLPPTCLLQGWRRQHQV